MSIGSITSNSAIVQWITNKGATSKLQYGLTQDFGLETSTSSSLVTSHNQSLAELTDNRTYYVRVMSIDDEGNQAVSETVSFTTAGASSVGGGSGGGTSSNNNTNNTDLFTAQDVSNSTSYTNNASSTNIVITNGQTNTQSQSNISGPKILEPLLRNLSRGSEGVDVKNLQRMLIAEGYMIVGRDSGYYGPLTEQAVQVFQYIHNIVTSGSPETTGYGVVGPQTRLYINGRISVNADNSTISDKIQNIAKPAPTSVETVSGNNTSPKSEYYTIGTVTRRTLSLGSDGFDVKALQRFLNLRNVIVSESGAGSLGNETEYFGSATLQAVIRFQNMYKDQILTPVGLTKATGIVGPSTWTMIEELRKI